ncbi:hypothetical protein D3Z39_14520 [Anaerotruncus colihominis]|uniref:Uncharacterized protein n=1 Tax=Anaerotruncus colihominis TaxID=169435 RepID=A0A845RJ56_9FIRM|nr:hypothetical protein [Anaerotruncus colihominis]NBI80056.1 hypothetical protein [Anaerotruncus colihominis]
MKRIKGINGYTIFQAGPWDVSKYGFTDGSFYVYFSSDVRDYGLLNSTPEFEDCGSIEEAEAHCTGNFAIAKELVEAQTMAAGMDEILEVEALLNDGAAPNEAAGNQERIEEARQLMEAAMHAYAPPKWWHYYKHAKKSRVRKKYEHRICDSMLAALAALREEGEGCRECITPAPSVAPI